MHRVSLFDSGAARPARSWIVALTLSCALLPSPTTPTLFAQDINAISPEQLSRIVARLADSDTGAPIQGALVTLETLQRRALTDSTGTVIFLDLPAGSYTLRIQHIAYGEQTVSVDVAGLQSAIVAIPLSQQAIALPPIDVLVENRPRYLEERGFYDRRVEGHGTFFDPAFIERWSQGALTRADRFLDLLLNMSPQLGAALSSSASGGRSGFNSIQCGSGRPAVYVDGQPVFDDLTGLRGPSFELEMISTYMMGAVEIYPSSQGVPYFALEPEIGCGSVVIWTNRWRGRTRELGGGNVELCEPASEGTVMVEGTIRDEYTGVLLPGAHVFATSHPVGNVRGVRTEEIISDRVARYRVCDLPPDHVVSLKVAAADRESDEVQVAVEARGVELDLTIRVAGPGQVAGRVLDRDTGHPVAAADILVQGEGSRTQSDGQGYFSLEGVLPGDHLVHISHLGFEPVHEVVSILADRTVDVRVELSADPIALEPIVVTAVRDRRLEMRGFYERRSWGERSGLGHYLDETDVERMVPAGTTSLLRYVPGVEVQCRGSRDCTVRSRNASSCARMNIFVNGQLALGADRRDPIGIDDLVRPSEIAAVEVYSGGGSMPAEFTGTTGRCGAVAIWTK